MAKQLFEINNVMGGIPCFIGTSVTVDEIRKFWASGYTPDATVLEYPHLGKNKIREAFRIFDTPSSGVDTKE